MKTLHRHHHHRCRPANLNAAHFSGRRPASGRERKRLNDALQHCGPEFERSSKVFSSPPQRNVERGNLKVPHLGLIQMTSWSWNSAVILRDGDGTGIKAGHSLISGSVLRRWASPSGAPADCCRSSPAPPWVWAGRGRRHFRGSETKQTLHSWHTPLLIA